MTKAVQNNQTDITEFILLGFGELHNLQPLVFLLFLIIYILTMTANILTTFLTVTNPHLHTPMYFFLGNLSCLEILYSSTILPKLLASLLTGDKNISLKGCMTQLFFFALLSSTECYLLSIMSYDRFLAICRPLYYGTRMTKGICIQLAAGSWVNGLTFTFVYFALVFQMHYCDSNEIDHFFCESVQLLMISCSHVNIVKYASVVLAFFFSFPPFLLTLLSYVYIIAAILRIPSISGRQKAFSTCSSHLIVVSIFYGAIIVVYLIPKYEGTKNLIKFFSISYTVFPPLFNPLIYSLRNQDIKKAFKKLLGRLLITIT